jgi:hypothetical protein
MRVAYNSIKTSNQIIYNSSKLTTNGGRVLAELDSKSELGTKDVAVSALSISLVTLSIPIIFLLLKCNAEKLEKDEVFN